MRYKNLLYAYTLEIMIGVTTIIFIMYLNSNAIVFLSALAIRPLILKRTNTHPGDSYWFETFRIGKLAIVYTSLVIIILYLIDEIFLANEIMKNNRDKIFNNISFVCISAWSNRSYL